MLCLTLRTSGLSRLHIPHPEEYQPQKGYRFFIDSLLQLQPLDQDEYVSIENTVSTLTSSNKDLALNVSSTLSNITHLAGIVTVPRKKNNILKEIDFIPLSDQRILAIIVINQKKLRTRFCK